MWRFCKRSSGTLLDQWLLKRELRNFGTVLLHSYWSNLQRKYFSKIPTDITRWVVGQKHKRFREFWTPFLLRVIRKNPRSIYARVSKLMAQFVLKIEKLSHIMGPTPILETARAYGFRSRLWLLPRLYNVTAVEYIAVCLINLCPPV